MKKLLFSLVALAMLTSCEKGAALDESDDGSALASQTSVPVTLSFYDVSMSDLVTPSGSRADEEEETPVDENASALKQAGYFKHLSIAIFPLSGEGEPKQVYQESTQADFGKLSIQLPLGKYQLVAVAYRGENPVTIKDKNLVVFSGNKVADMVFVNQTLDINTSSQNFSCAMDRAVTAFTLHSTDLSTPNSKSVRVTFKTHCNYQFDPATSFIPSAQEYFSNVELSQESDKVSNERTITFYTFLDQAVQDNVEVKVEVLDDANTAIYQHDFSHVKLEQKKRTTYTGRLFSSDTETEFTTSIVNADSFTESDGSQEFE